MIHAENCIHTMDFMPDNHIDLTVTSPPYDGLRTYNGYSFDFETIAKGLFRVTKKGGVVVWVVGDSTVKGSESGTSFKQALFFKEIGFNLHDTMVYQKVNYAPKTHNRYEQSWEFMFVLSKRKPATFNPIRVPCKTAGEAPNWSRKGSNTKEGVFRRRDEIITVKAEKYKDNIWAYTCGSTQTGHPAPFPLQLAKDHITSWSNEGDLVYDPFTGSGTTAVAALKLNRKFIGSEISQEYVDLANRRIAAL